MSLWIDTHCHLDAAEFHADAPAVRARARQAGVGRLVIPGVAVSNFQAVRELAHLGGDAYALGIHPLYIAQSVDADLATLAAELTLRLDDPRLVAVGEIGLDFFVPALQLSPLRDKQEMFYRAQLLLAPPGGWRGIAHAFNGSAQQAQAFIDLGLKLGFGGSLSFEAARQIRKLASELPLQALVLETDAPDIPPQWLYQSAQVRAAGAAQGRNEPAELPRIAQVLADVRGMPLEALARACTANALAALPRLSQL